MMNYGYQVVVSYLANVYEFDNWNDTWAFVKAYPVADVYWNGKFMANYTKKGGRMVAGSHSEFPEPDFESENSGEKTVSPKYRVVWRKDGTYVEFNNQDEAEAWGKENLEFFDIFHEPAVYVKTWKYDKGYDTWYSSYAPALITSKPKVEFSGHDFSVQLSGKENAVRNFRQLRSYVSANQAGEVELIIAWEKLTQRLIQ